jgi:hypothetical protein
MESNYTSLAETPAEQWISGETQGWVERHCMILSLLGLTVAFAFWTSVGCSLTVLREECFSFHVSNLGRRPSWSESIR